MNYKELLEALQALTPEQLAQPVQVIKSHPCHDHVYDAHILISFSTVGDLEFEYYRSSIDNTMRLDDLVLYVDGNPFGEEGAIAYNWHPDGSETPIFPGHAEKADPATDWNGPAQELADALNKTRLAHLTEDEPNHIIEEINSRLK